MILGNGDIASVLTDREDRLYFASGVSNSRETRESEYARETKLLLAQSNAINLVYFSSLSVFYGEGRYAQHKKEMERIVKNYFKHYTIVRLGNITWGNNPNTLINYMRNRVNSLVWIDIQDVYRYIVDKNEFLHWAGRE